MTQFEAALDDDLNMAAALAALFDMILAGNKAMDENRLDPGGAAAASAALGRLDRVLGVLAAAAADAADAAVQRLVQQRQAARQRKDWREADRLRDELAARGWVVKDTPDGPKLKRK